MKLSLFFLYFKFSLLLLHFRQLKVQKLKALK